MAHDIQFADCAVQAPVKVFGLRLHAFSIGHEILLNRTRNALVILNGPQFAAFSPESQAEEVRNAVLICSRSWAKQLTNVHGRIARLWSILWLTRWVRRIRKMDHQQAVRDFCEYRWSALASSPPGTSDIAKKHLYGDDDDKGRQFGSPLVSRLYNFLCRLPDREVRQFGETVFDIPFGFATFLYFSHLEQEGSARIENEDERKFMVEYNAEVEQIPAENRQRLQDVVDAAKRRAN